MRKVLIIEDDSILISHYKKMLQSLGLELADIRSAKNGREAIELVHHFSSQLQTLPDIILLDLEMPEMNGLEFLELFSKVSGSKKTKIIVVSSTIDPNDLDRAAKFGAYQYVTKPLREEILKKMIQ